LGRFSSRLAEAYRLAKQVYVVARYDWPLARHVAGLLKAHGIGLVHHNNSLPRNRATIMAARLAGLPQVCHVRDLKEFSTIDRYCARFVDAFIYISTAVEQRYRASGIDPHKGHVVYNPFDAGLWRAPAASRHNGRAAELRAELDSEFGLKQEDRIISNVGRLDWWKGQDYFLQAIAEVVRWEPNVRALLVGAPDSTPLGCAYHRKLEQMVTELGLSQHVTLTGFRSDVPRLMAASDIVIHSASEPEPFGRVVVEAMLAGRPVVATAAGGVLDVVEDQITGLLVQPKDAHAMAYAMLRLLQNPEQAQEIGRRAQQRAEECFSLEQHVTEIERAYDSILADRTG
jgi:glycosyltransferase involved in cell wall biosynthesis